MSPETLKCPECQWQGEAHNCERDEYGHGLLFCPRCFKESMVTEVDYVKPVTAPPSEPQGRVEFTGPLWRASVGNMSCYFGTEKECHQFIIENLP